jgi:hypothetical protein
MSDGGDSQSIGEAVGEIASDLGGFLKDTGKAASSSLTGNPQDPQSNQQQNSSGQAAMSDQEKLQLQANRNIINKVMQEQYAKTAQGQAQKAQQQAAMEQQRTTATQSGGFATTSVKPGMESDALRSQRSELKDLKSIG